MHKQIYIALSCLLLSACSQNNKQISFQSAGVTQTYTEGNSAIPPDFPLPIYPGSMPSGSMSSSNNKSTEDTQFLMLSVNQPYQKVSTYYQDKLKSSGWMVGQIQNMPNMTNIEASKNDLEANVMLTSDGAKTTINLDISKGSTKSDTTSSGSYTQNKLTPATD